jgi:hypothetical protein
MLRPIPFEDLDALPAFWTRVGAMFSLLFKNPTELVDRLPATDSLSAPWRFNLLLTLPYLLFTGAMMGVGLTFMGLAQAQDPNVPKGLFAGIFGAELMLIAVVMSFCMFIWGLMCHAGLWLWGGTRQGRGLAQTFRAVGYGTAFMNLTLVVPILGPLVWLTGWVFLSMGLARLHRTDTWRGICGVIVTFILCCCGTYLLTILAVIGISALRH